MKKIDFSNYKFRASSVKNLMTFSRNKEVEAEVYNSIKSGSLNPKDAGLTKASLNKLMESESYQDYMLSETTKTYLRELWIEEVFDRKKVVKTRPMDKGTIVETETIELLERVDGNTYFKNPEQLENDFVKGTPDIVAPCLIDIKSSWDLWTFSAVDFNKAKSDYYWQLFTYGWLTHNNKGDLVYGLVNTPEHIIDVEVKKLSYSLGEEIAKEVVTKNHTFDDIPEDQRVKKYTFEFKHEDKDLVKKQIILARQYLSNYSLVDKNGY